ncbi:antiterminator Q family protein [Hafnia alvei]|uniref:antiterminator Q family protein n=1 Tax=Hafnia alvei TaxID=569 RepID=UPI001034CE32|nr:antiterminator Q family protein [Hafnia alvei]TBM14387.1 antitermination protein [Hafnia alvei]
MRDIQKVLDMWGAWVASDSNGVDWPRVAAGFKGITPPPRKSRQQCCDDDGIAIDTAVGRLKNHNYDSYELLILYYVLRVPFRKIGKMKHCSDTHICKRIQAAEGFIDGCLAMAGITLELDC